MPTPTSPETWWQEYAEIKEDVKGYVNNVEVNALLAKPNVKGSIRILFSQYAGQKVYNVFDDLEKKKDHENLALIMNSIWFDAPDNPSIHSWPSWGRFCDLLSEVYVFEDE
jgi:hypothetical protein